MMLYKYTAPLVLLTTLSGISFADVWCR